MLTLKASHWRALAILCIAVVWVLSLWPGLDLRPPHFPNADKAEHFLSYTVVAWLLCRGWPRVFVLWIWLAAVSCGGAAEIGQALFTTTRHPDWWDMLANALGAFTGVVAGRLTLHFFPGAPD